MAEKTSATELFIADNSDQYWIRCGAGSERMDRKGGAMNEICKLLIPGPPEHVHAESNFLSVRGDISDV